MLLKFTLGKKSWICSENFYLLNFSMFSLSTSFPAWVKKISSGALPGIFLKTVRSNFDSKSP